MKIRPEQEHMYNSPWNIAAVFDMDMSFSAGQVAAMLVEYEEDTHTGMNIEAVSSEIYQYTSGYPYLVSAICKLLDEKLPYSEEFEKFVEKYGRKFFLLYLKPIINGTGNFYLEAQIRDERRTDVIVDYLGEQFIVELKIWHGNEYSERGEKQLISYLEADHKNQGYLLSFNFNKRKEIGVKEITIGGKTIVEAVV